MPEALNILVNFPPGFYKSPRAKAVLARLDKLGSVRRRSWNTPDEIGKDFAWANAVIMWSWPVFTDAMLDANPKFRFAGQLDVSRSQAESYLKRGIPFAVARRCWSPAVAEMALGLTLGTLRKISDYHGAMRAGREYWIKDFPHDVDLDERELTGRSVGIIGFGAVGRRFGELLAPFKTQLRIYDPYLPDGIAEQAGGRRVELDELLTQSDVVVICAASNKGTKKLLGKAEIAKLRKGAVLVNVARAALVDTDALVARLKKKTLYAAVDVFDMEPTIKNHPLRKLPNAYCTPHRAGGLITSIERGLTSLVDDFEAHLNGQPLKNTLSEKQFPGLDG
jgi:phosphoglycerate dehydrogenase-like enzyme